MSRIKRTSPALLVAILALVAALVVPALAQVATTALSKKEKRVVRKVAKFQANRQISRRAGEFTPAGEVHNSGRVVLNDPTPGDLIGQTSNLLVAGSFTIQARCAENLGGGTTERADLLVTGPSLASFSGTRTDLGDLKTPSAGGGFVSVALASFAGNQVNSGHVTGVAPNGQVLSASGSAEVNDPAGACVFGATAIGP